MGTVDEAVEAIRQARIEENRKNFAAAIQLYIKAGNLIMKSSNVDNIDVSRKRREQAQSIFKIADSLRQRLEAEKDAKKPDIMVISPIHDDKSPEVKIDEGNSLVSSADEKEPVTQTSVPDNSDNLRNTAEDKEFLDRMGINNIDIPEVSFDDVAGLDMVKDEVKIKILLPLARKDLAKFYDIKAGGGILMYGAPGNGKTYIAKAIAHEAHAYFVNINPSNLLNPAFGQFEKNIEKLFRLMSKHSPTVLFFDEFDAIAPKRSKTNSSYMKRAVPALLSEMDGVVSKKEALLIIAATNNPWDIDEAFLRPGRFDERIYIPPPDLNAREILFEMFLKNTRHGEINYSYLATITDGFSAADIKYICNNAKEKVFKEVAKTNIIRDITEDDLTGSIMGSRSSINNELLAKYEKFRDS
jgi:transitional endoplasmic reticulum ATPase